MSVRDELKPIQKYLVMDLLEDAGVNVSQWKNYKGANPAANPKYCYNWSFEETGRVVVLCLWHHGLKEENGQVYFLWKPKARASVRKEPGAGVWNRRNVDFGEHVRSAYRQQLPIRVIVVDGDQRNPLDLKPKASVVKARLLDPKAWAITQFDVATGEFLLERGKKPIPPVIDSSDLERSWREGQWSEERRDYRKHRVREAKARDEKIREALRTRGGKLVCEVPGCGFDFAKRYGPLGERYAQVHHLLPLSKSSKNGQKTTLKDLAIVCANCHVMIHLGGECRPLARLIARSRR